MRKLLFETLEHRQLLASDLDDGGLRMKVITAYNLVVDSNVETPASYGPRAAHLGVQITNTGTTTLTDIYVNIGDLLNPATGAGTPGIYPITTVLPGDPPDYSGSFSLAHDGGTADATRQLLSLAPGETTTVYWLVSYPVTDAANNSLAGAANVTSDDLVLRYDVWAQATEGADTRRVYDERSVTLRNEISAMANKIWPNTTGKVPDQYLDAFQETLGWRPDGTPRVPGANAVQGIWYDFGQIGAGFDNDGDLVPDRNAWMQPVGDPSLYSASCARLAKTYGILIVKLNDGTEQLIPFEDQMYFEHLPANNTGAVGLIFYEFLPLQSSCTVILSPYQEVASGNDNEKFNGDYGTAITFTTSTPSITVDKTGPVTTATDSNVTFAISTTNTGTTPFGAPEYSLPAVLRDSIPTGTTYVAGSAAATSVPSGATVQIFYSTNNGGNWLITEPADPATVTDVQWNLSTALGAGQTFAVQFATRVPLSYASSTVDNCAGTALGTAPAIATDCHTVLVLGNRIIGDTVFSDNGAGGGIGGDGLQNGAEAGLANIGVSLYVDHNNNGVVDDNDILWGTTSTDASGSYQFTSLPDGRYVVVLYATDPDRPTGWVPSTDLTKAITLAGANNLTADFGFSPSLDVEKNLIGSSPVDEGSRISYSLDIANLLKPDGYIESLPQVRDMWLTNSSGTFGTPTNAAGATTGDYAAGTANGQNLVGTDPIDPPLANQTTPIEHVEAVLQLKTNPLFRSSDSLALDVVRSGVTVGTYTITGNAINAFLSTNATGLVTLNVTAIGGWTWANLTAPNTGLTVTFNRGGGSSPPNIDIDRFGFRVTSVAPVDRSGQVYWSDVTSTFKVGPSTGGTVEVLMNGLTSSVTDAAFDTLHSLVYVAYGTTIDLRTPDGAVVSTFSTGGGSITGLDVDGAGGFVYWSESNAIRRATLNGASITTLVSGLTSVQGLAVDTLSDQIFWIQSNSNRVIIQRSNLDGTGAALVVDDTLGSNGNSNPQDIELDPVRGKVYFTNNATGSSNDYVGVVNMDGTNPSRLVSGINEPLGLAIDVSSGKMYWGDSLGIRSSTIAGTGVQTIYPNLVNAKEVEIPFFAGDTVGTFDPDKTLSIVPLTDDYDPAKLRFVSASQAPTSVDTVNGLITWDNVGPINPGITKTIVVTFDVLEPPGNATDTNVQNVAAVTNATVNNGLPANDDTDTVTITVNPTAVIGDTIWSNKDGDTVQDPGELGIPGVKVDLYDGAGAILIASTYTDSSGRYQFAGLTATEGSSTTYQVRVDTTTLPSGFINNYDPDGGTANRSNVTLTNPAGPTGPADSLNQDFGYDIPNVLYGAVWRDYDANGARAAYDAGIGGVSVQLLNSSGTVVATTTTATDGSYRFLNVADGSYRVQVVTSTFPATGTWTQTADPDATLDNRAPTAAPVSVINGDIAGAYDFGYALAGTGALGDELFYDWDQDGVKDATDEGIPNVTISLFLDLNANGAYDPGVDAVVRTTSTNASGIYGFNNLPAGRYLVAVDEADADFPDNVANSTSNPISAQLFTGVVRTDVDFGYSPYGNGTVDGVVWHDQDLNQLRGFGESGISAITVTLWVDLNGDGTYVALATTSTDANGNYSFSDLPLGNYRIVVDAADPDLPEAPSGSTYDPTTATQFNVTLSSGTPNATASFGFAGLPYIGDAVYFDNNANGTQDLSELGIANVTLQLFLDANGDGVPDGAAVATTTTNASGFYYFYDRAPSLPVQYYIVRVNTATLPYAMLNSGDPDRDGVPWTGVPDAFPAADNQDTNITLSPSNYTGADFGYVPRGSIGDFVWRDQDADGIQDPGELGLAGVTVTANNGAGTIVTTTTDQDGYYSFGNLVNGTWTVTISGAPLVGLAPTYDADGGLNNSTSVTISGGAVTNPFGALGVDFGLRLNGSFSLGGVVCTNDARTIGICDDIDNVADDGVDQDLGANDETELAGQVVYLYQQVSSQYVAIASTTTAADGSYLFFYLPNGNYKVVLDTTSVQLQYTALTTTAADTPATVVTNTGTTVIQDVPIADANVTDVDFAFLPTVSYDFGDLPLSCEGTSFAQDGARHIIPTGGATIYLGAVPPDADRDGSPTAAADGDDMLDGTDDEDGVTPLNIHSWTNGINGGSVQVIVPTGKTGYLVGWIDFNHDNSLIGAGEVIISQTITGTGSPQTIPFNIPAGTIGVSDESWYARFRIFTEAPVFPLLAYEGVAIDGEVEDYRFDRIVNGSVGDRVWLDRDSDGVQDAGEPGIPGVTVALDGDLDGNGSYETTLTTVTGVDGAYLFASVPAAPYRIRVSAPSGTTQTYDADGTGTANQSSFTLVAGQTNLLQDFGYVGTGSIGDRVWFDADADATQDIGEPGLPSIPLQLLIDFNLDSVIDATFSTSTNASGNYSFTGLPAANYTVQVTTQPAGSTQTFDASGALDNQSVLSLAAGQNNSTQDFGYTGGGSLGDFVWFDVDGDGVQDLGEPGIANVQLTLTIDLNGDNVADYTANTTTNAAGGYSFGNLIPGTYRVTINTATLPTGMASQPTFDADGTASANTSQVTLTVGSPSNLNQDFGYQGTGSIGNTVFLDLDGNGTQDVGEPGIPGIAVTLSADFDSDGIVETLTTTTGPGGAYLFPNLPPTTWTVSVGTQAGTIPTTDLTGDGVPDTQHAVTLLLGQARLDQDFGFRGTGVIGDRVWFDQDTDGVQDAGELGYPGVSVALDIDFNLDGTYDGTLNTVSGVNGAYGFTSLAAANYRVRVTAPTGTSPTFDADGLASANQSSLSLAAGATNSLQDFGYVGAGSLGDRVWFDADGDGVQDVGEPGLPAVPMQLEVDLNSDGTLDGTLNTTTNASGLYGFSALPPGLYAVVVTPASGWAQTFDLNGALDNRSTQTLAANQSVTTHDFGYRGNGQLGDFVWFDADNDGVQDAGEPGIANVQVTLTLDVNGDGSTDYTATQTTNASGFYNFTQLIPGTYTLAVNTATLPTGMAGQPTFDADGTSTAHTSLVTITAGAPTNLNQDFGYRGTGLIGDTVFLDSDGDGTQDPGEPGIPGVNVTLSADFDGDGIVESLTTTTVANGFYSFDNLPPSTWTVTVSAPAGTSPTTDFSGDGVGDASSTIILANGQVRLDQDFGFQAIGQVGDRVWLDLDSDGVQDLGEPGIVGAAVALDVDFNNDGVWDGTLNTIAGINGVYSFTGMAAAVYRVRVTAPAGTTPTYDADGTGTAHQSSLTLAAGASNLLQDFGYVGTGTIGDRVWFDADADATQDAGEPGLPSVPLQLLIDFNLDLIVDASLTTSTNATGGYSFAGLPAANYTVQVTTQPAGTVQTFDASGALDNQSALSLAAGQNNSSQDFGYTGTGTVGDFVWFDMDSDGVQDAGEPGIANVQITAAVDLNGDGAADYATSTTTNANGGYLFTQLVPGDYTVTVSSGSLPAGMASHPTYDANGVGTPHVSMATVTAAAPNNLSQDFGYRGAGSIGDTVFFDVNGNGVQNSGEAGIPGVTVTLSADFDGDGSNETFTTTTDSNGNYLFANLPPSTWTVSVSAPLGTNPTTDLTGDSVPDSAHTFALSDGQARLDQDFGFLGTGGQIGDRVWFDQNANGVQDSGEFGFVGVAVALDIDFNGDGTYEGTLNTVTGVNGSYVFSNLSAGNYRVRVTQPTGASPTADADGVGTPNQSLLTLAANQINLSQDFGYVGAGSIGDRVWFDANANAGQDVGEPGLPNVPVQLQVDFNNDSVVDGVLNTTTNASGTYSFSSLPAGQYAVVVTPTTGWVQTFDFNGGLDNRSTQSLGASQTVSTHDFGYRGDGLVGDYVWFDLDGDGSQDANEPGLAGVQVTLTIDVNGDGSADYTATDTTDGDGGYSFANLIPGAYTVTVNTATLPAGMAGQPTFDGDGVGTPHTSIVTITAAAPTNLLQDFGYRGTGQIGDTVFFDADGDGFQDPTDPGIPSVVLTLSADIDGDGIFETLTSTDANGNYLFQNLPPNTWTITVTPPAGASPTTDLTGDGVPDATHTVTLGLGQQLLSEDFGFRGTGQIGDRVWFDQDANGAQGGSEFGFPGVSVALDIDFNVDGVIDGTLLTTTGVNGAYGFGGLVAANYRVRVTAPAGTTPTFDADGTGSANQSSLSLAAGATNLLQDFGYVGAGSIGDRVWFDANGNGAQDSGEPGLPNVPVQLQVDFNNDGAVDGVLNTTTNASGNYIFTALPAGFYEVIVTPAAGWVQTFDLNGALDNRSTQTLAASQSVTTHDFGYRGAGVIGDYVWFDRDADGVQDASEPGIANVQVTLTIDVNGDGSADYSTNATTDTSGGYQFTNLIPGAYTVTVNTATLPAGMAGQPTFDADGVGTPHTSSVTITAAAPTNLSQDFGYRGTGTIGDTVFFDANVNGTQDPGEPGIPGVTVTLSSDFDGDTILESFTTTTGVGGAYQFNNLPPATWTVAVTPPAGASPTSDLSGDGTPDSSHAVVLSNGQSRLNQDFGFAGTGQVGDRVWFDQDADGVQDGGEFGFPAIAVALDIDFNQDGTYDGTLNTTTGVNGAYLFGSLLGGAYRVRVTAPTGTTPTFDADGTGTANVSLLTLAPNQVNLLQDFGYVGAGSLGDRVWFDANANGAQDVGEPGLPNVPVQLQVDFNNDSVVDGTINTTTNASGNYGFSSLPAGQYAVVVTPAAGWFQTFDLNGALDNRSTQALAAAQSVTTHDFGYRGNGLVGDYVWFDLDADGNQDVNEPGLAGVQVTLTIDVNGDGSADYTATDTTDGDGGYSFANLIPGTYTVTVNTATLPAGMAGQPTFDGDGVGTPHTSIVTITAASPTNLGQDFGYRGTGTIGDTVFFDADSDGFQDPTDPGIPGVVLTLSADIDGDGIFETLTSTDANGNYLFQNLPPNTWTITVTPPAGTTPTTDLTGDGVPDATHTINLALDEQRLSEDFGFRGTGQIGDRVWFDQNANGVQDGSEFGIPGVTVNLDLDLNLDGTYEGSLTTTTGANGAYLFAGLAAANYRVRVTAPAGTTPTFDADGTASANQSSLSLAAGVANLLQDFGYVGAGSLGDRVWFDANGNGVQDSGEPGLPNAPVQLQVDFNSDGVVDGVLNTTTNASGNYGFTALPAGFYEVVVTPAAGWVQTFDLNGALDNRSTQTLAASQSVTTHDFGYRGAGVIGDYVWFDQNADGVQDANEPGIANVQVTLTIDVNGDGSADYSTNTTTNTNGGYQFANLIPGTYSVTVNTATLPTGMVGQPTFDADGVGTPHTSSVTITAAAPTNLSQDFGYRGTGTIGDTVFFDTNGNGTQDPGEPGIPGVVVTLSSDFDGDTILESFTTTTGVGGAYQFTNLPPATWTVAVTPPAGSSPTSDLSGDGTPDSSHAVVLSNGQSRLDQDFGFAGTGQVGDRVWFDQDADGVQDGGEFGFPAIAVALDVDFNQDGTYDGTLNTTTGVNGAYLFGSLLGGAYRVRVTAPTGTTPTFDADGTGTANVSLLTLAPNQVNLLQDFGYVGAGSLGDRVWFDANTNGTQDVGEPGLPNVPVQLQVDFNNDSVVDGTINTTTDSSGGYGFSSLPAGQYTVVVTPAAGWVQTFDLNGALDNRSTQALAAAESVTTHDFGYRGNGLVGDFVWFDLNGDGAQNANEPGLAGVQVTLTIDVNGDGAADYTATDTTDGDGGYSFANLIPGTYRVTVNTATLPVGMAGQPTFDGDGVGTPHASNVTITAANPTNIGQDFGYRGTGVIGDTVFFDADGDGFQDPVDPGIPGVALTISADIDGDGVFETFTSTDQSGNYLFQNLPPNTWTITVTPPAGTSPTSDLTGDGIPDATHTVTLGLGQQLLTEDFGFRGTGQIGDRVWFDQNANGVQDGSEFGIPGVTVALDIDFDLNGIFDGTFTTSTGATGAYQFVGLAAANYRVRVTAPAGTTPTFDADGTGTANQSLLSLAAGATNFAQDFGYVGTGSIGDNVWFDANGSGSQDFGEPGLPNVPVQLQVDFNNDNVVDGVLNTTTNVANGNYLFSSLPAGRYTVVVTPAAGWISTFDLDGGSDNRSTQILTASLNVNTHDFGFRGAGVIGDYVWFDQDADGVQDASEPGIANVQVNLAIDVNGDGSADYSTNVTTNSNGGYQFANLIPGTYVVTVNTATLPAGMSSQPTFDADGVGTPHTSSVAITAGAPTNLNQDFGYRGTGTIGDTVFFDANGNGTQDSGEPGIPGVVVTLSGDFDGDTIVESFIATTGAGGFYQFNNLPPATWTVAVNPPAGTSPTTDFTGDGVGDSAHALALANGATRLDQDFGFRGSGQIGDRVWFDQNANGSQDGGEPGLANVVLTLTLDLNGDNVVDYSANRTTDVDGLYQFSNLIPGTYRVTINSGTLPAGMAGQPTFDADGTASAGTSAVTLTAAVPVNLNQDFGYRGTGAIGDTVFFDANNNGVQDVGEPGIPGAVVTLSADLDNDGFVESLTTTTVAGGAYVFNNLPPATWTVSVAAPAGTSPTTDLSGDGVADSAHTLTLGDGQFRLDQDFGFRGTGQVGDRVWFDQDADGVQDGGEFGFPGIGVALDIDFNLDGTWDGTLTTQTGVNGAYLFSGMAAANYRVRVTQPAGATPTFDADGTGTANQSLLSLAAGGINLAQDFGYVGAGVLGDRVWFDANANGAQDVGEPGLPNVPVQLQVDFNSDGVVDGTLNTSTNSSGLYGFSALPAGLYRVVVTPLPGTVETYDVDGTLDDQSTATLTGQETLDTLDFGYRGIGSLGSTVWFDQDADGTQDAGEPGLSNVQVTIALDVNGDGVTDYTAIQTTNTSGTYLFSNLIPGTYTVSVNSATLPAGMAGQPTSDADGIATPNVSVVTLTSGAPTSLLQNFGYRGTGSIGDTVFFDPNGNGVQGVGEPGIPGVVVTLSADLDGDGIAESVTTTTGVGGAYLFNNLPPATWTVTVTPPSGGTPTTDLTGDGVADSQNTLNLGLDETRLDQDFGYRGSAAVGDRVWIDVDRDGVQDPGEPGINGLPVTLNVDFNQDGVFDASFTTVTSGDGNYSFSNLLAGSYRVVVTPLPGTNPTFDADGVFTVNESQLGLAPSQINFLQDFGYVGAGTIAWEKRADVAGTPLLGGATFVITPNPYTGVGSLTVSDGGANDLNATGGQFLVDRVLPGTYVVTETVPPPGYLVDDDADRVAVVTAVALDAVIGTQGVFDGGATDESDFLNPRRNVIVLAQDKSPLTPQLVRIVDRDTGAQLISFQPYETSFTGGIRVATGDLTGDGVDEIIVAPGRSRAPEVRVFTQTGTELTAFRTMAYATTFLGGVNVAVGDVNGDGKVDLVTAPSSGAAEVRVWYNQFPATDPLPNTPSVKFTAFTGSGGGSVAVADMGRWASNQFGNTLDQKAEIIVGSGPGTKATVKVYTNVSTTPIAARTFNPFGTSKYANGVTLSVARLNADAFPDILVASENGNKSEIREWLWNGHATNASLVLGGSFQPFSDLTTKTAPARVTTLDLNGDGVADQLASVQGPAGSANAIRLFNVTNTNPLTTVQQPALNGYAGPYFIATIRQVSPSLPVPSQPSGEGDAPAPAPAGNAVGNAFGSAAVVTPSSSSDAAGTANSANALDVNRDGVVSAIDALHVLNELAQAAAKPTTSNLASLDVNGDGYISAVDALMIINAINAAGTNASSAKSPSNGMTNDAVDAVFGDWEANDPTNVRKVAR